MKRFEKRVTIQILRRSTNMRVLPVPVANRDARTRRRTGYAFCFLLGRIRDLTRFPRFVRVSNSRAHCRRKRRRVGQSDAVNVIAIIHGVYFVNVWPRLACVLAAGIQLLHYYSIKRDEGGRHCVYAFRGPRRDRVVIRPSRRPIPSAGQKRSSRG